ncbi:MAG: metallophosphoesterase family protein [Puniceicoccales bacterium]|jgi:hypothetical protein|nr:metallophosphoesterase family protein [Puniceicoccales bacterium]
MRPLFLRKFFKQTLASFGAICVCATVAAAAAETAPAKPALRFREDGTFKIVQFSDTHYRINRDKAGKLRPGAQVTLDNIRSALEAEKPDLVVFTGDNVVMRPQKRGMDDLYGVPESLKIPYAVVLGNHDEEHDLSRKQIIAYAAEKPLCLAEAGPAEFPGSGTYVLKIAGKDGKTAAAIWCLDSNAYARDGRTRLGYDYIRFSQVNWYREKSRELTAANGGKPLPSLAFFHIPLHEHSLLFDTKPSDRNYIKKAPFFGTRAEKECAGYLNTGMFAAFVEGRDVMGAFVGHDHDNDYIGLLAGVSLGYCRWSGHNENTYNKIGAGSRVLILKEGKREFDTWVRTTKGDSLYKVTYPQSFTPPPPPPKARRN